MSSFIFPGDSKVKVNSFSQPRHLSFTGTGVTVTEDTANNKFTITITAGSGSGETNTYSNAGLEGVGIILTKDDVDFPFKAIAAGSSKVTVTDNTDNKTVDIDVSEANITLSNIGGTLDDSQLSSNVTLNDGTQTLTNKTLTTPIISSISNTGTLTLPTSTDTLVGRDTTDTLTNKTLTSPVISIISNTGTLTLPTSTDTLVGRATTDTLTNKGINIDDNTLSSDSPVTGDILRGDGSKYASYGRGTTGQVLTMNSTGTNFEWATPPAISNFQVIDTYDVYKISTTYYITNKRTNTTTSGTDFAALIQAILDAMGTTSYAVFNFDASDYILDDPISIPLSSNSAKRTVIFNGIYSSNRSFGTRMRPSSSFTTERYLIEGIADDGSSEFPDFTINHFLLYNHPDLARSSAGTALNGGATIVDCGGIKLEYSTYNRMSIPINHIFTQYLWRGIHIIGKAWYNAFENIEFTDTNANFSGNADLILENGGHTEVGNSVAKECHFRNIKSFHTGEMDYAILIKSGNYNKFFDTYIEGNSYRTALVALDNSDYSINTGFLASANVFYGLQNIDTNTTPSPDNRKAALYLNGTGCVHNIFHDVGMTKYPDTIAIAGDAKNNVIYHAGYWGNVPTIKDTGAGENNVIIIQGNWKTTDGLTKITSSDSIVKITDQRQGAITEGVETQSGDGSDTTFTIAHGCFTTPTTFDIRPLTTAAEGPYDVTVDDTNITVTYPFAPISATDNLKWKWYASVY